jgi:hypothetical protein
MSEFEPAEVATAATNRYRRGTTSFPYFVMELEQAVSVAESNGNEEARELRRIWGQLEIINALALDEGGEVPRTDQEVDQLIDRFLEAVSDRGTGRDEGYV